MEAIELNKILEKIAKLQSLATNQGATQAEAELAASRIQTMLDKYGLSMDQIKPVSEQTTKDVEFSSMPRKNKRMFDWEMDLVNACCYATGTGWVYDSFDYTFIGLSSDVQLVKAMVIQFTAIAQHLATKAVKEYSENYYNPRLLQGVHSLRNYRLSFLVGFAMGLRYAFQEAKRASEQANQVQALMVVKDALVKQAKEEKYKKLKTRQESDTYYNNQAHAKGRSAGELAGKRKQLESE